MDRGRPGQIMGTAFDLIKAGSPLEVVHREVVSTAGAAVPSPCWRAIAGVDTNRDVEALAGWLVDRICSPGVPAGLSGLWFGLYEVFSERGGGVEAAIELVGGSGFPKDEQWLFHLSRRAGFAPTPGLGELLPLAASAAPQVRDLVAYAVVLAYAMALSVDAIEAAGVSALLGGRPLLGVAAGFHDGDIALVGIARDGRVNRSAIAWI